MKKTKSIISGITWTIVNNLVNILYGIVSVPFLIDYFGKGNYGLIGIAISVNVYTQLLDLGMSNTNVRFFAEYIEKSEQIKIKTLFNLSNFLYIIIGVINTLILLFVSFHVGDFFNVSSEQEIILRNLLLIIALNTIFSWISASYDQFLRANELIDWIKQRTILLRLLQFCIIILTIHYHLSIEIYFLLYTFLATLIFPLTYLKTKKIASYLKFGCRFDSEMAKIVLPYGISLFSFGIFHFLAMNSRPIVLGNIIGAEAVADFNVISAIASSVLVFSSSFTQVLLPIVTKFAVNNDKSSIEAVMLKGTKYAVILLSFVIFLLVINIKEILVIYVGNEYVWLSKWAIVWLLTLLLSHRNILTSLVFTETKLKSVCIMAAIAMTTSLVLYFVLTQKLGVGGVILGFSVHELIHTVFYYVYFLPKKCKVNTYNIFTQSVFPVWIVLLAAAFVPFVFSNIIEHLPAIGAIVVKTTIYSLLSLVLLRIFIIKKDEWFQILNTLRIKH